MSSYVVAVEGLDVQLDDLANAEPKIRSAASKAINGALRRARTRSDREIRNQVAFPGNYLNPSTGRLTVSQSARPTSLEGMVTARQRPTSLARFVKNKPRRGEPVRLRVSPGKTTVIPRAFLIPLRSGNSDIETKANLGLAIRLKPGEKLNSKRRFKRLASGLYLLYGPSVDQVFRSVGADEAEPTADFLEAEFSRLLDL